MGIYLILIMPKECCSGHFRQFSHISCFIALFFPNNFSARTRFHRCFFIVKTLPIILAFEVAADLHEKAL